MKKKLDFNVSKKVYCKAIDRNDASVQVYAWLVFSHSVTIEQNQIILKERFWSLSALFAWCDIQFQGFRLETLFNTHTHTYM